MDKIFKNCRSGHVGLAIALVMFSLSFLLKKEAAAEPLAYKATTVDECIQEKECVWIAFARQIGLIDRKNRPREKVKIHKWTGALSLDLKGENEPFSSTVNKSVTDLKNFYPYKINSQNASQHLIIFSNDVEAAYSELDKQFVLKGAGRINDMFVQAVGEYECFSIAVDNIRTNNLEKIFTIINSQAPYAKYCTAIALYNGLGFEGKAGYHPFSLLSDKNIADVKYTDLDKLLLFLLYQPEFKSGQDLQQAHQVFDRIYLSARKNFLEIRGN